MDKLLAVLAPSMAIEKYASVFISIRMALTELVTYWLVNLTLVLGITSIDTPQTHMHNTHIHIYTQAHTPTHTNTRTHTHAYAYTHTHTRTHPHTHTHTHIHTMTTV